MRRPFLVLGAVLLPLSLLRLALAAQVDLIPDEAYYWSWSLHPDWCYWDQPAGIAWAILLWTKLFGDSVLALRALGTLCSTATSFFIFALLRRVLDSRSAFWSVVVMQIVPLFAAGAMLILHDSLLLLFAAIAWWAAVVAVQSDRPRWWLVVGAALTGALYAKFSAVLLALGLAGAAVWHPRARRHLRTPWPYLGALLPVVLFAPVIAWNMKHQWVAYYAVTKLAENPSLVGARRLLSLLDYLGGQLGVVTPFIAAAGIWALIKTLRERRTTDGATRMLLVIPAALVLVYFLVNSLQAKIQANWPAMAWLALAPMGVEDLLHAARGRRLWRAMLAIAIAVPAAMTLVLHIQTFRPLISVRPDITDQFYGWNELAQRVQEIRREHPTAALMTTRYQIAAELQYHLPDRPPVYTSDFSHRGSEFTILLDYDRLVGKDAIFVDPFEMARQMRHHFAEVVSLPSFARRRGGREVETLYVQYAREFHWAGPLPEYFADPVGYHLAALARRWTKHEP